MTDPTLVAEDARRPTRHGARRGPATGGAGRHRAAAPADPWLREILIVVVVALVVAVLLRTFVVQTFFIPSGSMEPTLQIGDRILVNKLSYHLHAVHRGDIVVFTRPPAENCGGAAGERSGQAGHRPARARPSRSSDGLRRHQRQAPRRALAARRRSGHHQPGPPGTPYNLAKPYKIPANALLRHGRQPHRVVRQPLLGPDPALLIVGKVDVRVWPLTAFHFFFRPGPPDHRGVRAPVPGAAQPGIAGHQVPSPGQSARRRGAWCSVVAQTPPAVMPR